MADTNLQVGCKMTLASILLSVQGSNDSGWRHDAMTLLSVASRNLSHWESLVVFAHRNCSRVCWNNEFGWSQDVVRFRMNCNNEVCSTMEIVTTPWVRMCERLQWTAVNPWDPPRIQPVFHPRIIEIYKKQNHSFTTMHWYLLLVMSM